jgi:hypothetical protein
MGGEKDHSMSCHLAIAREGRMAQESRKADQTGSGVEEWAGTAQNATKGAAQKVTEGASYVQDKLGAVDATVRDYTGKPLGEWTENLKTLMRERPMMGAALMIATGYMAARICAVALRPR